MKRPDLISFTVALGLGALLLAGCGHQEHAGHDHNHDHGNEAEQDEEHGHGHDPEPPSGASFKAGEGVRLADATRKSLGVEIADIAERALPRQLRLTMQVFGERHQHRIDPADHAGCDVHGSAFLSAAAARAVRPGQSVEVLKGTNPPLAGVVLTVQKALALGESEVVLGISNATTTLKPGEFVPARINLPRHEAVTAIPRSALLRTAEGTFVYAVKGDAFSRTAVKVGSETDDWLEITDGLRKGDRVVNWPVETLYLIELRATKGGGHSH